MKSIWKFPLRAALLAAGMVAATLSAVAQPHYIITNDDASFPFTGVTFYAVNPNGGLRLAKQVATAGTGIGGGYFGANRIIVLNTSGQACVFASEAGSGDVVGIDVNTLTVGGSAHGTDTDAGAGNGIGLAGNGGYLYAGFSDSNTIGTFKVLSGCGLMFVNSVAVGGVEGGFVNGLAARGNLLIATYTDGTIESFNISGGTPLANGDKQVSTATTRARGATYPNSIDITSDGHFAIFGDTSTSMVVEVSDISSGKLTKTKVYTSTASISSSNVMLSPDESLLYVVNTQGDSLTVLFFNKATGGLKPGCTSGPIRGHSTDWSYLAGAALAGTTGDGDGVFVAEFPSGLARVKLKVKGKTCTLREAEPSSFRTKNAAGLLSIGSFPPRAF
ncbi:MAG TPA: beta-propeller fold lactonase family protein [Terriglobales bacterium]|nr:beta-propeller fold lactonase family protein [Terriglobales bacterium]